MLILRGSPALSPFRLAKLLQDLTAAGLPARALGAEFVHVVETSGDLTAAQQAVLEKLLTYGPRRAAAAVTGLLQVVAPRPGTISPWSSKATDIARICGLANVKRIERAIAYTLDFGPGHALPAADAARLRRRQRDQCREPRQDHVRSAAGRGASEPDQWASGAEFRHRR